jgi:hypothetical protein
MQKYIGTKIIEAEPFIKSVPHIGLDENENIKKTYTAVPGYKVKYEDGYESWSPKAAFEKAYRQTDKMTFGLAIEALKKGHKVARKGWNGKNMWLRYIEPYNNNQYHVAELIDIDGTLLPYIAMKTADNGLVPWLASQTDILSEDWEIVGLGEITE